MKQISTFAALSFLGTLMQKLVGRLIFQVVQTLFFSTNIPNGMYTMKQIQLKESI